MGRILSVFGKDVDSKHLANLCYAFAQNIQPGVDNQLAREQFISTAGCNITYA
jgi:hypothetical protein